MKKIIATHGGYKNLKSFQMSEITYDLTYEFVRLYVPKNSRTSDQMQQAVRSGKQNISEGSQTSGTSKQSELRLLDVARASLEELLVDYKDFLREKSLPIWGKDDPRVLEIRRLAYAPNKSYTIYKSYLSNPESAANCLLCVINQTNYLLDQQLKSLAKDLEENGDFKDRYREVRKEVLVGDRGPSLDDLLKQFKMKRLPNGKVVPIGEET